MELQKTAVIQKLFNNEKPNPKDYPVSILVDLKKLGYIKTWSNEQNLIIDISKGVYFDKAVKLYIK